MYAHVKDNIIDYYYLIRDGYDYHYICKYVNDNCHDLKKEVFSDDFKKLKEEKLNTIRNIYGLDNNYRNGFNNDLEYSFRNNCLDEYNTVVLDHEEMTGIDAIFLSEKNIEIDYCVKFDNFEEVLKYIEGHFYINRKDIFENIDIFYNYRGVPLTTTQITKLFFREFPEFLQYFQD